jgi:hypothetical protein
LNTILILLKGNPALYLGKIFEKDQVYINGVMIGENGGKEVNFGTHRIYPIPIHIILPGENTIAIRLTSTIKRQWRNFYITN